MQTKIKYIFRDFRGVVANTKSKKYEYANQISEGLDIPIEKIKEIIYPHKSKFHRGKISEKEFREGLSKDTGKKIPKELKQIFHEDPNKFSHLNKSIVNYVNILRKIGYTSVILSDVFEPRKNILKKTGRYNGFDNIILSCDIGLSKYDDRINKTTKFFEYALKRYGINNKECIFIDDKKKNCDLAKKLGIKTIISNNPRQVIQDLKILLHIH